MVGRPAAATSRATEAQLTQPDAANVSICTARNT
jgi:hypothetical protein